MKTYKKVTLVCKSRRTGAEINRRIIDVRVTARRYYTINGYPQAYYDRERQRWSRSNPMSMYRFEIEELQA